MVRYNADVNRPICMMIWWSIEYLKCELFNIFSSSSWITLKISYEDDLFCIFNLSILNNSSAGQVEVALTRGDCSVLILGKMQVYFRTTVALVPGIPVARQWQEILRIIFAPRRLANRSWSNKTERDI